MEYLVSIKGFSEWIEEEIAVEINGITLICFMPNGISFQVEECRQYPVSIELLTLDHYEVKELHESNQGIEQIGDSFSYFIRGKLNFDERTIDAGLKFDLEELYLMDYWYLDGKYIQIRVDRIKIYF